MQHLPTRDRAPVSRCSWLATLFIVIAFPTIAGAGDSSLNAQADVLTAGLPLAAYALTALKKDKRGAWSLTKSLTLTVAGTFALNALVDKDTPNGNANDAFPSGHSAISFSSAAFIQRRYGWRTGLPAYATASYVGWLRVKGDEHDWADVLGGAALGIASSILLTKRWSEQVVVSPWIGPAGAGIVVQARW